MLLHPAIKCLWAIKIFRPAVFYIKVVLIETISKCVMSAAWAHETELWVMMVLKQVFWKTPLPDIGS